MKSRVPHFACALAMVLVGCEEVESPVEPEPGLAEATVLDRLPALNRMRPGEAHMLVLEASSPGFAGYYVDDATGEVVVRSTAQEAASRILVTRRVEQQLVDVQSSLRGRATRFEPATYSFSQLARFRDAAGSALVGADLGVTMLDADERRNLLTVGIEPSAPRAPVLARLERVGIPAEAVHFKDMGGLVLDVAVTPRTSAPRGPLLPTVDLTGGMRITRVLSPTELKECTLGLFTEASNVPVGITNSHCSEEKYSIVGDGTVFSTGSFQFGFESADRHLYNTCNVIFGCRKADANLISQGPYTQVTWHQHEIVWRPNLNTVQAEDDSYYTNFDPSSPRIVAAVNHPSQGETIYKTGATTGRTQGQVVQTCIDVYQSNGIPASILECQNEANYFARGGDSGAPVYASWSGALQNVNLKGIHYGRFTGGSQGSLFSSMHLIDDDFGETLTSLPWGWPGGGGGGGGCGDDEGGPGDPIPC